MREFIKLGFATLFSLLIFVACDKDEKIPTPPGEKAIQDVLDKLENMEDVSEFLTALKTVNNLDLENDQITVFAVKDGTVVESTLKTADAGILTRASSSFNIRRHIVAGRIDLSNVTATLSIESINGDKLEITKDEKGVVTINGVELAGNRPESAGNSYIYIITDEIPEYKTPEPVEETEIKFLIHETNDKWNPDNDFELNIANEATISIFTKSGDNYNLIDEITTSSNGDAIYKYYGKEGLYFTVKKNEKTPFFEGFRIIGLFTSQDDIDNSPAYQTGTALDNKSPGSLKVADLNGDGIINNSDKVDNQYLLCDTKETNEIVIGELVIIDSIDYEYAYNAAIEEMNSLINLFIQSGYNTEYKLKYGDADFPGLRNITESETLWKTGYQYINLYTSSDQLFNNSDCPVSIKDKWDNNKDNRLADIAYIYGTLYNYFGDVPIVTQVSGMLPSRNNIEEIIDYLEMIRSLINNENKAVVSTVLARLYLTEDQKQYEKVVQILKEVQESGLYNLSANDNVYDNSKGSDKEIIYGDFAYTNEYKKQLGKYAHPIILREVYLTLAESYNEIGDHMNATMLVDMILQMKNKPLLDRALPQAELREKIRDLMVDEFEYEDKLYMFYKRWGTFMEEMGNKGAEPRNKILPIPQSVINSNSSMTQNPGY